MSGRVEGKRKVTKWRENEGKAAPMKRGRHKFSAGWKSSHAPS